MCVSYATMIKIKLSKEENYNQLFDLYITQRLTVNEISKIIGLKTWKVREYLRLWGIANILKQKFDEDRAKILNKKFGLLVAKEFVSPPSSSKNKFAKYLHWVKCTCDCGKTTIVPLNSLKNKKIKSCGCQKNLSKEESKSFTGYKEISGKFFSRIKRTASGGTNKRKRICKDFNLTIQFLWDLYEQQNRKCALSGLPITFDSKSELNDGTCSLDRKNSQLGYVPENVQWVHKKINIMKNSLLDIDFINLCIIIANFNLKKDFELISSDDQEHRE